MLQRPARRRTRRAAGGRPGDEAAADSLTYCPSEVTVKGEIEVAVNDRLQPNSRHRPEHVTIIIIKLRMRSFFLLQLMLLEGKAACLCTAWLYYHEHDAMCSSPSSGGLLLPRGATLLPPCQ